MWDKLSLTSLGGNSRRRIFTYAMSTLVVAFLWVLFATTATHALESPGGTGGDTTPTSQATTTNSNTATWQDGSIVYQGNTYSGPTTADGSSDPKLASGDIYYQKEVAPNLTTSGKAYVIYFSSGVDPGSAKTANYVTYTVNGFDGSYSAPSKVQSISITPSKTDSTTAATAGNSSCTVPQIGWIVCPVSNFLANGMDTAFNVLKSFLIVQPLGLTQNGTTLYQTWNYIRSFANVAFVIVFMIIIYSQITNMGITNYGIKKLLPRLIIAAILVLSLIHI